MARLSIVMRANPSDTRPSKLNMLIVDDEAAILTSLKHLFRKDYNITTSASGEDVMEMLTRNELELDIVICDERMAGMKGHELLEKIHRRSPETICVLATGYADMASLVKAVNKGHIYNYIEKPWNSADFKLMVDRAAEYYRIRKENIELNQQLRDYNAELEQRVSQRTKELDQRNKQLEEARLETDRAMKVKERFFSNISHELRTPLNSIIGFSSRLKGDISNLKPERFDAAVDSINRNGIYLLSLVNDLLDLSSITEGEFEILQEQVSIYLVIDQVVSDLKIMADESNLYLDCQIPSDLHALGDPVRIRQIFVNVINNAIKYTNKGGVRIDSVSDQQTFTIRITDTGIGISDTDQERLFDVYNNIPSETSKDVESTGLGLALVKKLCELQNITISVTSKVDEGSTFSLTFNKSDC